MSPQRKVDVLNDLSYALYDQDDSAAFQYARLALREAGRIKYNYGLKYSYLLVGMGGYSKGDYNNAIVYWRKSRKIDADHATDLTGYSLMLQGSAHRDLGNYDSALYYYDLSIKTIGERGDPYYLAAVYRARASVNTILWKNEAALVDLKKAERLIMRKTKDQYVLLNIWSLYGEVYANLLMYDKAEYYLLKMCEESSKGKDYFHIIKCDLNKADIALRTGNLTEGLKHSFEALDQTKIYNYPPQRASILIKIAEIYEELSQYELATKYFFEALKITEKIGLRYETADVYSELAFINKDELNFDLAMGYINRSQAIRQDIGDRHGIANCNNIRGLIYYSQQEFTKAIQELNKSLEIRQSLGHAIGIAATFYNLSLVFEAQGDLDRALEYQLKSVAIEERGNNRVGQALSYNGISALYLRKGKIAEAEKYLQKGKNIALDTKSLIALRNNYESYAKLYEIKGDFKNAYESQKNYQTLDDSVYSEEGAIKLAEMQALYQVEQKEQEIKLLNQQKQIQEDQLALQKSKINFQNIVIISGIIGFLMLAVLAFSTYRFNRKIRKANYEIIEQKEEIEAQSEELIEANHTIAQINKSLETKIDDRTLALRQAYKELDTFFYRSSHDFRRPLTTFMGLSEVAKITVKDTNALELFDKVRETANNLDKMLIKLQSISDVGAQQLVYKEVFVREMFDTVIDTFREELLRKNIKVSFNIDLNESFYSYPAMVKIIIENLVENAIFFCGVVDPFIHLKAFKKEGLVYIEVQDNGQGIETAYQNRIFEMYFRGNERSKGNGLGLYIVKKAVEKMEGEIAFQSNPGMGSTFTVILPTDQRSTEFIS